MTGPFCAACGQESLAGPHPFVRSLRRQWERVRHSAVALVVHPGQLTAEFRDGQRARSVAPWRIAFNIVSFFFVLSFVTDFRVTNFARQDPSGTLTIAIASAAQQANVDISVYTERLDRRFDAIYTVFVVLLVAVWPRFWRASRTGVPACAGASTSSSHCISRHGRSSRTSSFTWRCAFSIFPPIRPAATVRIQVGGLVLLTLFLLWQFAYVLLAFRRVYADGWLAGAAKAALMIAVKLVAGNATSRVWRSGSPSSR